MSGTIFTSLLEDRVRETAGWQARRAEPAPEDAGTECSGSFFGQLVADRMQEMEGGVAIGGRLRRALETVEADAAARRRPAPGALSGAWERRRPVLAGFGLAMLLLGSGWTGSKAAPFLGPDGTGKGVAALAPAGEALQAEK